jgi:phage gp29-like protein
VGEWLATLRAMLDTAVSLEEFNARLLAAYPDLDAAGVVGALGQALAAADTKGRYDVAQGEG